MEWVARGLLTHILRMRNQCLSAPVTGLGGRQKPQSCISCFLFFSIVIIQRCNRVYYHNVTLSNDTLISYRCVSSCHGYVVNKPHGRTDYLQVCRLY